MLQGVLDEQFMQLQQLQDDSSPNFVLEVISIYFRESEKMLTNLRHQLYACIIYNLLPFVNLDVVVNNVVGDSHFQCGQRSNRLYKDWSPSEPFDGQQF